MLSPNFGGVLTDKSNVLVQLFEIVFLFARALPKSSTRDDGGILWIEKEWLAVSLLANI